MRRREFITVLGGATAWPLAARTQQSDPIRRVGTFFPGTPDDAEDQARFTAFVQGMRKLGWSEGRNLRFDSRWAAYDPERIRRYSAELVALGPDVILASGGTVAGPLLQLTRTVPIVFTQTPDPVGAGFVDSLARPARNATGFTNFEYGMSAKWLELLKEIAPHVSRVGVIRDATIAAGIGQFAVIQSVAPSFAVELRAIGVSDAGEIERGVTDFARGPNDGLIVTSSGLAVGHRDLIITLAAHHRLPTVYPFRFYVTAGGLVSYGADSIEPHERAAGYVDRILKGAKPADLPVQAPTKFELVINLKTAKALGIEAPPTLLSRANEVIE